jgi:XTP/dITP diphosphohydrolase
MTIWLASGNAHKKKEIAAILPSHTIKIPKDANIDFDPDETGSTFSENAMIKARALFDIVKEPVIADDSGICVEALDGRPGIYSARYGSIDLYGSENGKKLDDAERNALLIQELANSELGNHQNRKAHFVCAMVLLINPDRFFIVQETLEGELIQSEKGSGGFGYDPILFIPEKGKTVAELSDEEKNEISHRGKAGKLIGEILRNIQL